MVLFPDAEGLLRFANGMLAPGAAVLVGRVARARVGLYVNGELWSATDPPPSVEVIDRETLLAASRTPGGVRSEAGSVVAMDPRRGLPAAIAALAQPEGPGEQAIPLAVRLVIGPAPTLFDGSRLDLIREGERFGKGTGAESGSIGSAGVRSSHYSLGHARARATDVRCRRPRACLSGPSPHPDRPRYAGHRRVTGRSTCPERLPCGPYRARCRDGLHPGWRRCCVGSAASTSTLFYDCRSCGDWFRQVALRRTKDRPGVIHGSARTHSIGPDRSAAQTVDADQRYAGGLAAARRGKSDRTLEPNTMMKGHTSALAQYTSSSDPARRRRPSRQAATAARMGHSTRNAARLP